MSKYFRTRVNYQIRVPEVRVISSDGEQLGVMATEKAIELAGEEGMDLVEVSPTARPPVCRIIDYGKYKYEKSKRLKESKKKQHTIHVKEIKLRPKTEEHDYQFKKRHAEEFLDKAFKVKFTIIFRGRELDHKEMGARILNRIKEDLAHVGVVERDAQFEGRLMTMFMAPLPQTTQQQKKAKAEGRKAEEREPRKEPMEGTGKVAAEETPEAPEKVEAQAPEEANEANEKTKSQSNVESQTETETGVRKEAQKEGSDA